MFKADIGSDRHVVILKVCRKVLPSKCLLIDHKDNVGPNSNGVTSRRFHGADPGGREHAGRHFCPGSGDLEKLAEIPDRILIVLMEETRMDSPYLLRNVFLRSRNLSDLAGCFGYRRDVVFDRLHLILRPQILAQVRGCWCASRKELIVQEPFSSGAAAQSTTKRRRLASLPGPEPPDQGSQDAPTAISAVPPFSALGCSHNRVWAE